jgi:hypothetical protein
VAWTLLNAALRKLIHRREPSEWQAIARNLEMEISDTSKFPKDHWRSLAIKSQVHKIKEYNTKPHDILFILEQALLIRDERLANDYYRDAVTRARVFRLWLFVFFLTCFAIYISGLSKDDVNMAFKPIARNDVKVLFEPIANQWIPRFTALLTFISIAVYGALGATFSALRDFTASTTKTRIPEHVMTTWMTLTRPFVGAVSALIVVFAIMGACCLRSKPTRRSRHTLFGPWHLLLVFRSDWSCTRYRLQPDQIRKIQNLELKGTKA